MGTSSGRSDFWDRLGDQALVMIGRCNACPPKRSQKSYLCAQNLYPFPTQSPEWRELMAVHLATVF